MVWSPTLPANGPDPLPALGRSGGAACPGEGSPQPKQLGAPDLLGSIGPPPGPGSPYTIRHTAWAGPEPPRVHRCGHARGAAWLPLEATPTYRIQSGRRKCTLPQQSPRRLFARLHYWSRVTIFRCTTLYVYSDGNSRCDLLQAYGDGYYSLRPEKQVTLGFKICPKKQVILLYLEIASYSI